MSALEINAQVAWYMCQYGKKYTQPIIKTIAESTIFYLGEPADSNAKPYVSFVLGVGCHKENMKKWPWNHTHVLSLSDMVFPE